MIPEITMGIEVPLKEIEKNLTMLWQQAFDEKGDDAITRSNTMNLLIISYEPDKKSHLYSIIADVTLHHPSRVILLIIDPESASSEIKAQVTTQCNLSSGSQKQICFEQILLTTGREGQPFLSGVLLPLLLPDLPVFLWWAGSAHQGVDHFDALRDFIDHALFSSPDSFETIESFEQYITHLLHLNRFVPIADMNWANLTDWREAVAQFFDLLSRSSWIGEIDHLQIFQKSDHVSMPVMLLIGWLASQLGWKRQAGSSVPGKMLFSNREQKTITVRTIVDPLALSEINKAIISTIDHGERVELVVTRQTEKIETVMLRNGSQEGAKVIPLSSTNEANLLCHELDLIHADKVLIDALSIWSPV